MDLTGPAQLMLALALVVAAALVWRRGHGSWRPAPRGGRLAAQPLPADGPPPFLAGGTGPPTPHPRLGWALVAVLVAAALVIPELAEGVEQPDRATGRAAVAVGHRPARPPRAIPPVAAHVVLVVEENHEFGQVIGSRQAPFLNQLAAGGTLLTRYDAITHPSLPNYVALVAGDPLGIHGDCTTCHRRGRTLVDQLQAAGISWKAYYQGLPAPCSTAVTVGAYAMKVNPFLHLDGVRSAPRRCRRVVPLSQLGEDLRRGRLPRFAMVTPDLAHSMHSGSIAQADAFLRRLDQLLTASTRRSGILLIVTFDEGISDHGLHGRRGGGHVATIVVGPGVPAGGRDPTPYDHYALLRSLEQRFGLRPLRHAADRQTTTIPTIAGPGREEVRMTATGTRRTTMRRWRGRTWTLLAGMLLVAAGCATGQGSVGTTPTSPPTTTARGAPSTGRSAAGGSRRIIVVVEENHSFDQVIGAPQAPFLNRLAGQGTLLTSFFAVTHPSLPNYIAMVSGDTQGITSDCGGCNVDAPNLVDQLEQAGISWKAYMEDLPAPCSDAHQAGPYAKKHDPFVYFASIRDHPGRCAKVVPASQLDADLGAGRLPRFAFITPNLDHDMHGAGEGGDDQALIGAADEWLRELYGKLTASPAWRDDTRLVVTWDEGRGAGAGGRTGCCGGTAGGGHIPTIVVGSHVPTGRDATDYDHYALLRSVEAGFHLPFLGHAGDPTSATIPAIAARSGR